MTLLSRLVDERFLAHRRRSTSIAGMTAAALALGLFLFRLYVNHVRDWDLFVVGLTFVFVKIGVMVWSALSD